MATHGWIPRSDRESAAELLSMAGVCMRICAQDLAVGDTVQLNDWQLHIVRVECEKAVAVVTAEFGFLINFGRNEFVTVHARAEAA
jgi:hypothetical protein